MSPALIHLVAGRWIGTPFSANACVPGPQGGVSCQRLASAIYVEAGVLTADVQIPAGRITRGRWHRISEIEPWLDGRREFVRTDPEGDVCAGDLLGFRIGHCISHLGVALGPAQFIHCLEGPGTVVSSLQDATWLKRCAARWRPVGGIG